MRTTPSTSVPISRNRVSASTMLKRVSRILPLHPIVSKKTLPKVLQNLNKPKVQSRWTE